MTPEEAQRELSDSRGKIDSLDRKIVDLLNERTKMAQDIGRAKTVLGTPVQEPRREESVFRNVTVHNHGPMPDEALKRIYEQIMLEMRTLQGMQREQPDKSQALGEQ
ncbi:MAG: chorismate mutase [Acidobacteriota bacterium]